MNDPTGFASWVSAEAKDYFRAESSAPAAPLGDIAALRGHYDAYNRRHLAVALEEYKVDIAEVKIGGVRAAVVTPSVQATADRTLICLHGGAFMWGRGAGALLEAVPVAATAGMRVIALEYALAPERAFPAAVDDVIAAYLAVVASQPARSVGIYGCSAGGVLTAQATARMIAEGLPAPGAISMLCGAGLDMVGDSVAASALLTGQGGTGNAPRLSELPYLAEADPGDPLVFPGNHPDVLKQFPPSLLVTGSRDFAASSVTVMHRRLLAASIDASLLHFDGMWHAFHMATTLPEARELFSALASFFNSNLA